MNLRNTILCGDVLKSLKLIPDKYVNMVCCSPPYWALRNYKGEGVIWDGDPKCEHQFEQLRTPNPNGSGGTSELRKQKGVRSFQDSVDYYDRAYYSNRCVKCNAWKGQLGQEPLLGMFVDHLVQVFRECKRVLRDDGALWVNLGDTYAGTGHKKGCKDGINPNGRNGQDYAMNNKVEGVANKSLCMIPERFAIAMIDDEWILRNKIIWYKPNAMPSSAKDRFGVDYEYFYFFTKKKKYYFETQYEPMAIGTLERSLRSFNKGKSATDEYAVPHRSVTKFYKELGEKYSKIKFGGNKASDYGNPVYSGKEWNPDPEFKRLKRSVWKIPTASFKEAHFAVYPEKLIETPILACCPPNNGIVLDPFFGSGTTGIVANRLGRDFIGIDVSAEYCSMAANRLGGGNVYDVETNQYIKTKLVLDDFLTYSMT